MVTLIDASVLIAVERGQLDLEAVSGPVEADIAIAALTASELLHGAHRAATAAQLARREAFVEGLLERVPVIAFDLTAARVHARIWAETASSGVVLGAHDLVIAATAIAAGARVATRDQRSFPKIPGLQWVAW